MLPVARIDFLPIHIQNQVPSRRPRNLAPYSVSAVVSATIDGLELSAFTLPEEDHVVLVCDVPIERLVFDLRQVAFHPLPLFDV